MRGESEREQIEEVDRDQWGSVSHSKGFGFYLLLMPLESIKLGDYWYVFQKVIVCDVEGGPEWKKENPLVWMKINDGLDYYKNSGSEMKWIEICFERGTK